VKLEVLAAVKFKASSSGLWCRVVMCYGINVSKVPAASIFRKDLWNVGMPPHHYTVSQPRGTRILLISIRENQSSHLFLTF